jgi:hypothetical protein
VTLEEFKITLATLIDEQTDLDSGATFADAQMALMDTSVHEPISVDDAFVVGFVLAAFLYTDDGGVGPRSSHQIPERAA